MKKGFSWRGENKSATPKGNDSYKEKKFFVVLFEVLFLLTVHKLIRYSHCCKERIAVVFLHC